MQLRGYQRYGSLKTGILKIVVSFQGLHRSLDATR